jgi:hypothetical protein
MARRTNYTFDKRQKEKQKAEKAQKKRERRQEKKEMRESGETTAEDNMVIAPLDPEDLGLPAEDEDGSDDDGRDSG